MRISSLAKTGWLFAGILGLFLTIVFPVSAQLRVLPKDTNTITWLMEKDAPNPACSPAIKQIIDAIDIQPARTTGSVFARITAQPDGRIELHEQMEGPKALTDHLKTAFGPWIKTPRSSEFTKPVSLDLRIEFNLYALSIPDPVPFPSITNPQNVVIRLERLGYNVTVHGNGRVEYEGARQHVFLRGKHHGKISQDRFSELLQAFRQADYFSLEDKYTYRPPSEVVVESSNCRSRKRRISGMTTDGASTVTSIEIDGKKKEIVDYDGAPEALELLERAIDQIVGVEQWIRGNTESVPGLLAEGYDINDAKTQPIMGATEWSTTEVVRDLIRAGAKVDIRDRIGRTPLSFAAWRGEDEMVAALLEAGTRTKDSDKYGVTPLMYGAASGNDSVVRQLLRDRPDINARDTGGSTALIYAAETGNPKVVELLLSVKARVNDRDNRGTTPLLATAGHNASFPFTELYVRRPGVAIRNIDHAQVVRLLLSAGADVKAVTHQGETALFTLEDEIIPELVRAEINLNARDKDGCTALAATVSDSVTMLLINAGANIEIPCDDGRTALMSAADHNYIGKLKALLGAHAAVDKQDRKGRTALILAVEEGLEEPVTMLLEARANPNIRNNDGKTALGLAKEKLAARGPDQPNRYKTIVQLLINRGATDYPR